MTPSIAWIGGANGTVLRTTNSGTDWFSVGGGTIGSGKIYSVDALNDSVAFVTTTHSSSTYIFRTTNSGTNWTQVYSLSGGFINAIWMLDETTGMAFGDPVGGKFVILKTTDAGQTWNRILTEPSANANEYGLERSLCIRDNTLIWFGTSSGRIIKSTDLGVTWSASTTLLTNGVITVWFNDNSVGLIAGVKSDQTAGLGKSIDSGKSWQIIPGNYRRVTGDGYKKFFGNQGGGSLIYQSPDTSFTWTFAFNAADIIRDINIRRINSENFGWAVGSTGTISRYLENIPTSAEKVTSKIVYDFSLSQNFPNPFNPSTTISYDLPKSEFVTMKVYDMLGREVAVLLNEEKSAGSYTVEWNAHNAASGLYIARMRAGDFAKTIKMTLMK
ncbi:MAG: T9SS type A sorting domain-containing protein [Bacteroidota bacterium]